jgi:hypothetical protein
LPKSADKPDFLAEIQQIENLLRHSNTPHNAVQIQNLAVLVARSSAGDIPHLAMKVMAASLAGADVDTAVANLKAALANSRT